MAVTGFDALTLSDWGKRYGDAKTCRIIEVLEEKNEILDDILFMESNQTKSHEIPLRAQLPEAHTRMINAGVPYSKSSTMQKVFTCAEIVAQSYIDKALVDRHENGKDFRFSEETAFIQSLQRKAANLLFYGNQDREVKDFNGLVYYYDSLKPENKTSVNIVDAKGTKNLTSVYFVSWGKNNLFGFFPKGSKAGLIHEDMGIQKQKDKNDNNFYVYESQYTWNLGLALADWRSCARVCNIDLDSITDDNLIKYLITASEMMEPDSSAKQVVYMNKQMRTRLRNAKISFKNTHLSYDMVEGKKVTFFDEIPVRRVDAITLNETKVAA